MKNKPVWKSSISPLHSMMSNIYVENAQKQTLSRKMVKIPTHVATTTSVQKHT